MKGKIIITISEGDYDSQILMRKQGTWRVEGKLSEDNNFVYDVVKIAEELLRDYLENPPQTN